MQRSLEQFQISPEAYFADIDHAFSDIRGSIASLGRQTDELTALCRELARARATEGRERLTPSRWSWDVRMPNYLFDNVFDAEEIEGGAKRWVMRNGRISLTLALPRDVQYDVAIDVQDFATEASAHSFYLRIDGVQHPWLSHDGNRYRSFTPTDIGGELLALEIGVDPATIPEDRDVSFSFRGIDVVRRS